MALRLLIWLGSEPSQYAFGLSLLVTYWWHVLLWAGVAALLARAKSFTPSAQHALWKLALLAPIGSALLATVLPAAAQPALGSAHAPREVQLLRLDDRAATRNVPYTGDEAARGMRRGARSQRLFLGGVLGVSGLGLLRFGVSVLLLSRRLRGRTRVPASAQFERFERLRRRLALGPVALTESANIDSPMVIGMREICLPYGSRDALSNAELDAVLAHELAHLQRADGVWFPIVSLLSALLWMQPINRWLSARFRHTAELACDDTAVQLTRAPAALALALLHVAEGSLTKPRHVLTPTMRGSMRALVRRVERLRHRPRPGRNRLRPWAIASLVATALATASLNVSLAATPPSPRPVQTVPAPGELAAVPPDLDAENSRMAELLRREHALSEQLAAATVAPGSEREGSAASVRVLELQQELEHVRATESWTEQRFSDDWQSWEKQRLASVSRSR